MDPIGFCFAESLRGIKHFQNFEKADYRFWNEKSKHPFSNNKMERLSNGPHWGLLCRVPSGNEAFQDFKMAHQKYGFWNPNFGSSNTYYNGKTVKWTPTGVCRQTSTQVNKSALFFADFLTTFFLAHTFFLFFIVALSENRSKIGRPTFLPIFFFLPTYSLVYP